jgi:predicted phosphohydrolase
VRIVGVADTHLFHEDLTVPDGDVFVHAGDLCRAGNLRELEIAARWIGSLPHRTKIIVAGNHDWAFARERARATDLFDGAIYLEDSEVTVDGVRFWGSPWQPAFHGWAFNLPRGRPLEEKWALIPEGIDVLITHGPPYGIGDRSADERCGCEDLLARVKKVRPKLHLFGHIHQDGGIWEHEGTRFANITTWECDRAPTVIDL